MTFLAIVPLAVYAVLLGADLVAPSAAAVAVLLVAELVAVAMTVRALARRYRECYRQAQAHDRARSA